MRRYELSNEQWRWLAPLLPPEHSGRRGRPYVKHRRVLNGILWVLTTGAQWAEMPRRYGSYKTCHGRLLRWKRNGLWDRILQSLQAKEDAEGRIDWEASSVDATIVKAHQDAAGARRTTSGGSESAQKGGLKAAPRPQRKRAVRALRRSSVENHSAAVAAGSPPRYT
jgi:transposase